MPPVYYSDLSITFCYGRYLFYLPIEKRDAAASGFCSGFL